MKPVEARNTMIKSTRSPSASPPRPSPGCAHSPRSVERWALDFQEATYFLLCKCLRVSSEYKMMRNALLQGGDWNFYLWGQVKMIPEWLPSLRLLHRHPSRHCRWQPLGRWQCWQIPMPSCTGWRSSWSAGGAQWRWKLATISKKF